MTAGYDAYRAHGCDALVAVGGGSCIDTAKGIAILSGNGGSILDYEGIDKVAHPIPPLVMAPSTAGTGSDVSQFAVITDTSRRLKATITGRALVPNISITDPRLCTTMPADLAAATGLDALSHAIEAFVSQAASFLTDQHALGAIRLIAQHLSRACGDPDDLEAREGMSRASLQAGLAFTNAILGATHAMSHQIGGALDLPHGLLNGILLPHVMRFNAEAAADRYVEVARALGIDVPTLSPDEAAEAAAGEVRLLADKLGIPRGLGDLGLAIGDLELFAENTLHDACLTTNPRPVDRGDVSALFHARAVTHTDLHERRRRPRPLAGTTDRRPLIQAHLLSRVPAHHGQSGSSARTAGVGVNRAVDDQPRPRAPGGHSGRHDRETVLSALGSHVAVGERLARRHATAAGSHSARLPRDGKHPAEATSCASSCRRDDQDMPQPHGLGLGSCHLPGARADQAAWLLEELLDWHLEDFGDVHVRLLLVAQGCLTPASVSDYVELTARTAPCRRPIDLSTPGRTARRRPARSRGGGAPSAVKPFSPASPGPIVSEYNDAHRPSRDHAAHDVFEGSEALVW